MKRLLTLLAAFVAVLSLSAADGPGLVNGHPPDIKTLKVGEVSDPMKFDVGPSTFYVIINQEATRPKGFADVNEPEVMVTIENKVRQINMNIAIKRWLDALRTKHHVQVQPQ